MRMRKAIRVVSANFLVGVLAFPVAVSAAGLVPCATSESGDAMCTLCDLFKLIKNIIDWLMGILAIVALVILVVAAIMYIVSTGNSKLVESAKDAIKNTLFGFAIVLLAWVIINVVFFVLPTGAKYKDNWWTMSC